MPPGYWCEAHHAITDRTDGGQTNIDGLTFACGPDNRLIDTAGWRPRKNTRNQTEWIPRPDLDRGQRLLAGDGQHRIHGYHHPARYLLNRDDPLPENGPLSEDGDGS